MGVPPPNLPTIHEALINAAEPYAKVEAARVAEIATFIPFGKHVERDPTKSYILATGVQECQVCKTIIDEAFKYGPAFSDLCELMADEMQEMCHAQQRVLQSCPEFTNNWCYQDLGGTQQLRSPCPDFLKCHYCLGMNPLHCLDEE